MPWIKAAPTLPTEVTGAAEALTGSLTALHTALSVVQVQIRTSIALARGGAVGALDSAGSLLGVLTGAVKDGLNALLDDGGGYLLIVPTPKKGLTGLVQGFIDPPSILPNAVLRGGVPADVRATDVWRQAFAPEALFTGGNAHYLQTVASSLFDAGDDSRPRFSNDTYWGYVAFLAGATDIAAAMVVATYFDRLFGSKQGTEALGAARGNGELVAQGLRASPSGRGEVVVLTWNPMDPVVLEDGARLVATHYAVIRSERPQAMTARQVLDLFGDQELTEGLTGRFGARVMKVTANDGFLHRYVDSSPLTVNQTYYYHLAVRTRLERAGTSVNRGYGLLSSAARYRREPQRAGGRHGKFPDWYRTPSLARLIPSLSRLLDRIMEAINSATSVGERGLSLAESSMAQLDRYLAKLDQTVTEIDLILSQINRVFQTPDVGVYLTLRQGQGNAASFLADLGKALSDPADVNRPPFETGDEYTTGVIVLVAAPSEAAFLRAWAMLELLFGPATEDDPVVAGVRAIQAGVEATIPSETPAVPSNTFNPDMTPRPAGTGDSTCD